MPDRVLQFDGVAEAATAIRVSLAGASLNLPRLGRRRVSVAVDEKARNDCSRFSLAVPNLSLAGCASLSNDSSPLIAKNWQNR